MILDVGEQILKTMGYKVLMARSGKEAIEIVSKALPSSTPDLVILDMIMPVIGGGETYDKLKEINPNIKVLLSSGYSIDGQVTEIRKRGCDGFIQKPFTMRELLLRASNSLQYREGHEVFSEVTGGRPLSFSRLISGGSRSP